MQDEVVTQVADTTHSGNTNSECEFYKNSRSRRWALTLWDEASRDKVWELRPKYFIYGVEQCPKTGRTHYQAFICFDNAKSFKRIHSVLKGTHIEPCHGSTASNIAYCKKDGDWKEFGEIPKDSGHSNVLSNLNQYNTVTDVMVNHPETYCKYRNGINDIMVNIQRLHRFIAVPHVIYLWGKTGTKKTLRTFRAGATPVTYNNGFFSDWGAARTIAIEEFRGDIPLKEVLKLCDQYHNYYTVNIKGGQKLIDLDYIYFTSPYPPRDVYKNTFTLEDNVDQFLRRICEVVECKKDDDV